MPVFDPWSEEQQAQVRFVKDKTETPTWQVFYGETHIAQMSSRRDYVHGTVGSRIRDKMANVWSMDWDYAGLSELFGREISSRERRGSSSMTRRSNAKDILHDLSMIKPMTESRSIFTRAAVNEDKHGAGESLRALVDDGNLDELMVRLDDEFPGSPLVNEILAHVQQANSCRDEFSSLSSQVPGGKIQKRNSNGQMRHGYDVRLDMEAQTQAAQNLLDQLLKEFGVTP